MKAGFRRFKHGLLQTIGVAEKTHDNEFDSNAHKFNTVQVLLEELYVHLDSYFTKLSEQVGSSVSVFERFRQLGATVSDENAVPELTLLIDHFIDSQTATSKTVLEPARSFYKKEILAPVEDTIKELPPIKKLFQHCRLLLQDVSVFKHKYSNAKKKNDNKKCMIIRDKLQRHESGLNVSKKQLYKATTALFEKVPLLIKTQLEALAAFQVHFHSRCHDYLNPSLDALPGSATSMVQLSGLTGQARDTEGLAVDDRKAMGLSDSLKKYYLQVQLHKKNSSHNKRRTKHGVEKQVMAMGTTFQMAHAASSPSRAASTPKTPNMSQIKKKKLTQKTSQVKLHTQSQQIALPTPVTHRKDIEREQAAKAAETLSEDTLAGSSSQAEKTKVSPTTTEVKKIAAKKSVPPPNKKPVVIALFDYKSKDKDEMSVRCGDRIKVLKKDPSGWWYGQNPRGEKGFFPKSYTNAKD